MKSKQLVLIAIALLCGLVSAIGIIQAMGNKAPVAKKIPMGSVLVASAHLDHKAELTENNVSLENWPKSLIPEGAATDLAEVQGKHITTRLRTGQAIILEDVMNRNEIPGLAIPPDHKVINIKVPSEDLLAGLLRPGDRVDIIGVFDTKKRGGDRKSETKTFLKAIRVFNIGSSTSAQDQKKKGSSSGIVGVLVTEAQSEKIVWAKANGEIRLAMIGDNVASSGQDPDFPMGNEPEVKQPEFDIRATKPVAKPQIDFSKLRPMKIYAEGKATTFWFDSEGNQVSLPGNAKDNMGSSTKMLPMLPMQNEAKEEAPVDYEEFDGSEDLPNSIEEDQYQGK